jgi:hypothetical protein
MTLVDDTHARYRAALTYRGETVAIQHNDGSAALQVLANVAGYAPQELTDVIVQGDRKVILLADDLAAAAWPVPKKGDRILIGSKMTTIQTVDDMTRRINGVVIAYEIQVRG